MMPQSTLMRQSGCSPAVQIARPAAGAFHATPSNSKAMARSIVTRRNVAAQAVEAPEAAAPSRPEPSYAGPVDTYAVVDIGGHQVIVEEGRWYTVNRLEAEPGAKIRLGRVLALKHDGKFHVGKPYLEDITVEAEILEDLKGPKVIVYKMKPKKHYRRTNGHRQPLTKFVVTKIAR